MALITDPDDLADSAADDGSQEVFINTSTKTIKLVVVGNLSTDGVTLKCLYSFLKEEWRTDPNSKNLAAFPFPMVPITNESFEFVEGWDIFDNTGRYLLRTAGWTVRNTAGNVTQKWAGIIGLGTIEAGDQLYYQQETGGSATNVQLTGQINQAVQILRDDDGDGVYAEGSDYDRTSYFSLFCREVSQLYGKSTLTDIGVTSMDSQAYRFPITTAADLKISDADAMVALSVALSSATWTGGVATYNFGAIHTLADGDYVEITGVTPVGYNVRGYITYVDTDTFTIPITVDPGAYTSGGSVKSIYNLIKIRYFDQAFSRDVDSTTERNFGIVVDVGTHSGVDGSTDGNSVFTSSEGGIPTSNNPFASGTLVIHEGIHSGSYPIIGNPTATTVTISGTLSSLLTQSFTIYPPVAVPATAEEIYTAVQYNLRQNSDIDSTDQSVTGKVADQIMYFVGDTLISGRAATGAQPTNPNGGGSGVIIEGFDTNDTNRLTFYDNTNTARNFPFVATLTINFGANLIADASAKYWVFFTSVPDGDYGTADAIVVDDNDGIDMSGNVSAASSVTLTFDYDNNIQGSRTPAENAAVTVIGIGLATGQYVSATTTITRSTSNSVSLVAALERNYQNP